MEEKTTKSNDGSINVIREDDEVVEKKIKDADYDAINVKVVEWHIQNGIEHIKSDAYGNRRFKDWIQAIVSGPKLKVRETKGPKVAAEAKQTATKAKSAKTKSTTAKSTVAKTKKTATKQNRDNDVNEK